MLRASDWLFGALLLYVDRKLRIISYVWKYICPNKKQEKEKTWRTRDYEKRKKIFPHIIINIFKGINENIASIEQDEAIKRKTPKEHLEIKVS